VTDRVRWYGEYPDEDLPRRMADADFLVLPSVTIEEMFGLVVLEAMAAGRPVITTALPSAVREVNVPGVTGLEVPLRDVGALAEALERLAHDPKLRRTMGEAGRKRVAEQFTQSAMAERHIALYERILAERS
jgi:rhamnosyl/mannosyltransferase